MDIYGKMELKWILKKQGVKTEIVCELCTMN
jgi:hypothetical protein